MFCVCVCVCVVCAVLHWQPRNGRRTAVRHVESRSLELSVWWRGQKKSFLRQPLRHSKDETTKDPIHENTSPHYQVAPNYGASNNAVLTASALHPRTQTHFPFSPHYPESTRSPRTGSRYQWRDCERQICNFRTAILIKLLSCNIRQPKSVKSAAV
jgi:hypothetical protein